VKRTSDIDEAATDGKKQCKGRCKKRLPLDNFPKSASSKDGKLGYCTSCWGFRMRQQAKERKQKALAASEEPSPSAPKRRKSSGKKLPADTSRLSHGDILALANEALQSTETPAAQYFVTADDGDVYAAISGVDAVLKAVEWMMDGYTVKVHEEIPVSELIVRLLAR